MGEHEMLPDGESTEKWAINEPGFLGTDRQLLDCARCGVRPPVRGYHAELHARIKPVPHFLCDDCWDALPD